MDFFDKTSAFAGIRDSEFEKRLQDENPVALAFVKGVRAGAIIGMIGILLWLSKSGGF